MSGKRWEPDSSVRNGKDPRQYGFDFGLWTRHIVRELIAQRFGVTLSLASVGALLARVGLTPQKPLERAYPRDPEAITRWQRETYPAIACQAKREGADLYFWDETGFRADAVHGTARPGARRAKHRWSTCRANARASAPHRR